MTDKKTFQDKLRPKKNVLSDEELTAFEVSEDRRLREMGIDPDSNPIEIMAEVRRRFEASEKADAEADAREAAEREKKKPA